MANTSPGQGQTPTSKLATDATILTTTSEANIGETHSRHNLLTIPTELLEKIAEHTDPQNGLLSLRLVSRQVCERISKVYIKEYFTERAFHVSLEGSLQALVDIAKSKYAKSMRKVFLCVDQAPPTIGLTSNAPGHMFSLRDKQEKFQGKGEDLSLLSEAFSAFQSQNCLVHIFITDEKESPKTPKGYSLLANLNHRYRIFTSSGGPNRASSAIIQALAASKLSVERLTLHAKLDIVVELLSSHDDPENRHVVHVTPLFPALERLDIVLKAIAPTKTYETPDLLPLAAAVSEKYPDLVEFNLRRVIEVDVTRRARFFLEADRTQEALVYLASEASFDDFLTTLALEKLRLLSLDGLSFDCRSFVDFIHRHKALDQVKLQRVWLRGAGKWDPNPFQTLSPLDLNLDGAIIPIAECQNLGVTLQSLTGLNAITAQDSVVVARDEDFPAKDEDDNEDEYDFGSSDDGGEDYDNDDYDRDDYYDYSGDEDEDDEYGDGDGDGYGEY